jgi:hypothetical protein
MALIETLTIELGSSIAKSILKIWLKDSSIASDASSSIIDVLKSWTTDRTAQRQAQRQFDEIGEKIGESLLPIFEADNANLDEGSRTAIALAVAETLNLTSSTVLAQNDLAPTELAKHLLQNAIGIQHFSDTERSLFQRIISESCEYIVDIASQLPTFTEQTFAEILRRQGQLLEITKQTLLEVRLLREQEDPSIGAQQFEFEYRRAIVRKLDSLELFGVDLPEVSRRHRLSIAYITLSVEQKIQHRENSKIKSQSKISLASNKSFVSVETALKSSHNLLIRGAAGSGKTTLLKWIAVNSALKSFIEPLVIWNKTQPFYISLRSCVDTGLPGPEDFPKLISRAIADIMPKGWVHGVLKSGLASVLIDGLDEVPKLQREDVRLWMRDLVETYPQAYFFVTSRPNAVEAGWMNKEGFNDAELQPMELSDIFTFIDHWHAAVADQLHDEQEIAELPTFAKHLKDQVVTSRPIRNLSTNPLLCAMLCALQWKQRQESLPSDRIKLYEICCEMLIESRDRERRIKLTDYSASGLSYREKLTLLEDLAYWMLHNGWTQVELPRAVGRFKRKLENMHNIPPNISSIDVYRFFIERTSLIREPIVGHIDFTHRTFKEFLAAKAALDEGDIGVLVNNAHNDQWQEMIILAAGLATRKVRERIIHELIKRGDKEQKARYQLHLLAVSCLDTTVELGQEVRTEVRSRLSALVPPKDMADAQAFAAAGELAVPFLTYNESNLDSSNAICIRALTLIGSDAALASLKEYAKDIRSSTIQELFKSWSSFDTKTYGQNVLTPSFQHGYSLKQFNLTSLNGFQYLTNLSVLNLSGCKQVSDLGPLAKLTQLATLDLSGCRLVSDLSPLAKLTQLITLNLLLCEEMSDLSPLAKLTQLTSLNLNGCEGVSDLSPLAKLTQLITLNLGGCELVETLSPLAKLTQLTTLNLSGCRQVGSLLPLVNLMQLTILNLRSCKQISDLSPLAKLTQLTSLDLSFCEQVSDLSPLAKLTQLTTLNLNGCNHAIDLSPLTNLSNLKILGVSNL